jgi:hypothetical protein
VARGSWRRLKMFEAKNSVFFFQQRDNAKKNREPVDRAIVVFNKHHNDLRYWNSLPQLEPSIAKEIQSQH